MSWGEIGIVLGVALLLLRPRDWPQLLLQGARLWRQGRQILAAWQKDLNHIIEEAEVDDYAQKARRRAERGEVFQEVDMDQLSPPRKRPSSRTAKSKKSPKERP